MALHKKFYTKRLEQEKFLALEKLGKNYNGKTIISDNIYPDIQWWIDKLRPSYNPLRSQKYALTIFTHAS